MKRTIYILIPVIILGGLISWRLIQKREAAAQLENQRQARLKAAPPVTVATAEYRDLTNTYATTGSLEAPLNVKISPNVSGRIDYLTAHEGDRISKGQLLVRINPSEVQGEVRQAEAALAEAQYRLAQAQITQSPAEVQVQTAVQQQQAAVATAQANLNQATQNYNAQVAAADAAVNDAQGRIDQANGSINNAKAAINSAQANLTAAQAKLTRYTELYKQGFIAAQDLDDQKAAAGVAEAALGEAQAQLATATSTRDSYMAQKAEAVHQASIVRTTGQTGIESARQSVDQAKAALTYAVSNLAQKPAYQQNLAALRATVNVQQGALTSARAKLADTTIYSPLEGYVTNRYMDPGAEATPGQPILAVQFFRQVWVSVAVPVAVSATLHLGQPTTVTFDALPGRTFTASIIQINPGGDPQSRQFTVRAVLSNDQGLLKPGMFAHVVMETQYVKNALTVPREAVQQDASGSYVMVVGSDDKVSHQVVAVGASDSQYLAITSGLRPGEQVVTLSAGVLRDGQTVSITSAAPAAGQALTGEGSAMQGGYPSAPVPGGG